MLEYNPKHTTIDVQRSDQEFALIDGIAPEGDLIPSQRLMKLADIGIDTFRPVVSMRTV